MRSLATALTADEILFSTLIMTLPVWAWRFLITGRLQMRFVEFSFLLPFRLLTFSCRKKEIVYEKEVFVTIINFFGGGVIFLLALLTSCPGSSDIKIHTVTFDLGYDGVSPPEKIEIEDGSVLSPVENPARDGYRFDGWYLKGSNVKYDFSLPVVSNIVLEAHWTASSTPTPTSYTVTYHAMVDGVESDTITVPESSTVQSGSMLQVPATPTYDNTEFSFVGWSTSGTEYVALASDHVVQGNLDLWAVFVKKSSTGTTAGGMLSYTFDEAKGGYTITGTTSATGAISIPSTINGAPVVEILAEAFKDKTSITSIDLSGATNLKTIGNVAFGFTNIKELTIPGNVETVGRWIVEGCSSLTSLTIEEGVKTLSESSFYGAAVKTIKIPSTITDIPAYCFQDSAIESIELHNGITSIGDAAFMNCSNLTALTIPGSVTHIGQWILQIGDRDSSGNWIPNPNTSITVTIEEGATGLSSEAFWGAPISTISIPSTITEIPELCFAHSSVKEVRTTGSIKTIHVNAFFRAKDLASFDLTGVETIGEYAFAHTGIKSIHIPASVNKIDSCAFANGDSLTVTFEEGFNGLAKESFYGAPISTITIPKSVTVIPTSCFDNATLLNSVTLHDDITEIMDYAFYDAEIEKIQLPTGLKKIGHYAFADNALTSLKLPAGLTSIGEGAFRNNPVTGMLVIPASVTEIRQFAFQGTDISGIEFKDGANLAIGREAFANAKNLREVTLPSSVAKLDITAFTYSTNHNDDSIIGLHSLTVPTDNPDQISLLGDSANAAYCTVYVPDGAVDDYKTSVNWCRTGRFTANNIRAKLTT